MPEQLDSTVLDSPEALSPKTLTRGGANLPASQQATSPVPVVTPLPPPPPPHELSSSIVFTHSTGQPPTSLILDWNSPLLPPLPPRPFPKEDAFIKTYKTEVKFCRDNQNTFCKRENNCNYIHCSIKDEMQFKEIQKLPLDVIRQNPRMLCLDFALGECHKVNDCKLWHIMPLETINDKKCIKSFVTNTNFQNVRPYIPTNNVLENSPIDSRQLVSMPTTIKQNYHEDLPQPNPPIKKLWSRPVKALANGSSYTNLVTTMIGSPMSDGSRDAPPYAKYTRPNETQYYSVCSACKDYEKQCDAFEQRMTILMNKQKEMEQGMLEISKIVEKNLTSMSTVLDIIARVTNKDVLKPGNGVLQNTMGNQHSFSNFGPNPKVISNCYQHHMFD